MNKFEIAAVKFQNALNKVFPTSKNGLFASAVICAGGSGTRMGGIKKQLIPLLGIPCIVYSLLAFEKCDYISEIIVVSKSDDKEEIKNLCKIYGISKLKSVVEGGDTRQKSVANGFLKVSKKSDIVAIHDAARPLIKTEDIAKLVETANRFGASCASKKMTDTVKKADDKAFISETVPRESLYTVQTPQVFKTDVYRVSLGLAEKAGVEGTDDCSLVEFAGFPIKLVDLEGPNFKLTTKEDVQIVTEILKERENG